MICIVIEIVNRDIYLYNNVVIVPVNTSNDETNEIVITKIH